MKYTAGFSPCMKREGVEPYQETINTDCDILIQVLPEKWRQESIECYTQQEEHCYSNHLPKKHHSKFQTHPSLRDKNR
jgi:hypothetical protein